MPHHHNLDGNQRDDDPLCVFDLSVANTSKKKFGVLLDRFSLNLDFPEAYVPVSEALEAFPDVRVLEVLPRRILRSRIPILAITSVNSVLFSATNLNSDRFSRAEKTPVRSTELLSRVNASSIASVLAA